MYFVIDIGGSSVKYGVWQEDKLTAAGNFPTPATWDALKHEFIRIWRDLSARFDGIHAVGVSVPGVPRQEEGMIGGASSVAYLHEVPFAAELTELFSLPVWMENDAKCAALAEITYGAAKRMHNALFVIIGTGIGGTLLIDGKILRGHHLFGGEFGMMLINGRDEWAKLGSAVHMARKVSLLKGLPENAYSGEQVFQLAEAGDAVAEKAVEELYHALAVGIYNLQYIIDPEAIVIGGGISEHPDLIANIERHLREIMTYGQRSPLFPQLKTCQFGSEANLIGAAVYCGQQNAEKKETT